MNKTISTKKKIIIALLLLLLAFTIWRLLRPLNIFVVEDKFAYGLAVTIPKGLDSISAKSCGVCHEEIYNEWSESIHAQAWSDPYYQVDMKFEGSPPVCINCHIPLQAQREQIIVGYKDSDKLDPILKNNPDFDAQLQSEGVTCAACHIRDGVIIGTHKIDDAPHPVKQDERFLSQNSPCIMCHKVSGDRWDMFYKRPPCGTISEIAEKNLKADCVGCHMPETVRPVVLGGVARKSGKHLFHGGHTPAKVKSALSVDYRFSENKFNKTFTLTLTNSGTNHYLPTGTPDRHLTVDIKLLDADNRVIKEKKEKLIRNIIWRPFIFDLYDSRLPYGEPRDFSISFNNRGNNIVKTVDVTVKYHLLEESRRKRIGYIPTTPINYPIYQKRIDVP
ncbi:MAG: hypothetical protein HQL69_08410 [Magnetococcales bacterium]|nr:hypothetical protein [Magnetococcales bacterium]